MHLLLARHGETEWNVERRIQGWKNSSLTDVGRRQAESLGSRLANVPLTAIYCSSATRADDTARTATETHNVPFHVLDDLRESGWGDWEGQTSAEIERSDPDLWARFLARGQGSASSDPTDWETTTIVPNGETLREGAERIQRTIRTIVETHTRADDWVLVVGHGGSLRFAITYALGLRPIDVRHFHLDNASLTYLLCEQSRPIVAKIVNDSSHWQDVIAADRGLAGALA